MGGIQHKTPLETGRKEMEPGCQASSEVGGLVPREVVSRSEVQWRFGGSQGQSLEPWDEGGSYLVAKPKGLRSSWAGTPHGDPSLGGC